MICCKSGCTLNTETTMIRKIIVMLNFNIVIKDLPRWYCIKLIKLCIYPEINQTIKDK